MRSRSRRRVVLLTGIVAVFLLVMVSARANGPCFNPSVTVRGRTYGQQVCAWPRWK